MWVRSRPSSLAWARSSQPWRSGGSAVLKKSATLLTAAVVMLCLTILLASGCGALKTRHAVLPPSPVMESSTINADGGICIDRADTAELLLYIEHLERMARE